MADKNDEKLKEMREAVKDRDQIIQMFENAFEYSRMELMDAVETLKAREQVSELSRKELMGALDRIKDLEVKSKSTLDKIRKMRKKG